MIARSVRPAIGANASIDRPKSCTNTTSYRSRPTPSALSSVPSMSQSTSCSLTDPLLIRLQSCRRRPPHHGFSPTKAPANLHRSAEPGPSQPEAGRSRTAARPQHHRTTCQTRAEPSRDRPAAVIHSQTCQVAFARKTSPPSASVPPSRTWWASTSSSGRPAAVPQGPVPVPRGALPVLQRHPGQGAVPLLLLRRGRRRHHVHPQDRAPRTSPRRSSGWPPAPTSSSATSRAATSPARSTASAAG